MRAEGTDAEGQGGAVAASSTVHRTRCHYLANEAVSPMWRQDKPATAAATAHAHAYDRVRVHANLACLHVFASAWQLSQLSQTGQRGIVPSEPGSEAGGPERGPTRSRLPALGVPFSQPVTT